MLTERGKERRRPSEDRSRNGTSRNAGNHQKAVKGSGTDYPSEHPEGTNFADTVISDFYFRTVKRFDFAILGHPVVLLLWQL